MFNYWTLSVIIIIKDCYYSLFIMFNIKYYQIFKKTTKIHRQSDTQGNYQGYAPLCFSSPNWMLGE